MDTAFIGLLEKITLEYTFGIYIVIGVWLLLYVAPKWKNIEEYFSYRSLKKYEQYISLTTNTNLKKILNQRISKEISFKVTGIRQFDLSIKIMALLVHSSLVLQLRDLKYYRYYFILKNHKVCLKEEKWFHRLPLIFNYAFSIIFFVAGSVFLVLPLLMFLVSLSPTINLILTKDNVVFFGELIIWGIISIGLGILSLSSIPTLNRKKMNELLDKFNHSENN